MLVYCESLSGEALLATCMIFCLLEDSLLLDSLYDLQLYLCYNNEAYPINYNLPGVTIIRLSLLYNFLFILSEILSSSQRDATIPKESKF